MLEYEINEVVNGYRLTVWQKARVTADRTKPYAFRAHYTLETERQCREMFLFVTGAKTW